MVKVLTLNPLTNRQEYIEIILGYPAPYFSEITPATLVLNTTVTLNITGSYFTPSMAISLGGVTINNVQFVNNNLITVEVTVESTVGFYDLVLNNGNQIVVSDAVEIIDLSNAIVDLRLGGTSFTNSAIQMRSGMNFTRTAAGLQFAGASPWSSWVRFVGDSNIWTWNRSEKKKLSWIFTNTVAFMIGIGSDESDPNSTAQYGQGEIMGYFNSSTSFYGFYGNNGNPGSLANQSSAASLTAGSVRKLVLENNGEPGSNFYLYELPSANIADWMDTSNLKHSGAVSNNMSADATNIMPFCIPSVSTSTLFLGFILE